MAETFINPKAIKRDIKQEAKKNRETLSSEALNKRLEKAINTRVDLVRVASATLSVFAKLDPSTSILTSNNALDNNFIPSTKKTISLSSNEEEEEISEDDGVPKTPSKKRDSSTYHPLVSAQNLSLEEFIEERLELECSGKDLSTQERQSLTEECAKQYYALRLWGANYQSINPGQERLSHYANLSPEEFKTERLQEIDPEGKLSPRSSKRAEEVITNEYNCFQGKKIDLAVGLVLPVVGGKLVTRSMLGKGNKNTQTPLKTNVNTKHSLTPKETKPTTLDLLKDVEYAKKLRNKEGIRNLNVDNNTLQSIGKMEAKGGNGFSRLEKKVVSVKKATWGGKETGGVEKITKFSNWGRVKEKFHTL